MSGNGDIQAKGPKPGSKLWRILGIGQAADDIDAAAARRRAIKAAQRARGVSGKQRPAPERSSWRRLWH